MPLATYFIGIMERTRPTPTGDEQATFEQRCGKKLFIAILLNSCYTTHIRLDEIDFSQAYFERALIF